MCGAASKDSGLSADIIISLRVWRCSERLTPFACSAAAQKAHSLCLRRRSDGFQPAVDGLTLLQQFVETAEPVVTRVE